MKRYYRGALLRQGFRYSLTVRLVRLVPLLGLSSYSIHASIISGGSL